MATHEFEGFVLRPVTAADAVAVTNVINSVSQEFSGIDEETAEEVQEFWQTPGIDMQNDIRVLVSPTGEVMGYAEAIAWNEVPVNPYIFQRVQPALIGTPQHGLLLDWVIERCKDALARVPEELRVAIGMHSLADIPAQGALLTSRGFKVMRHLFEMAADFTEEPAAATWPEGITLRPFDAERDLADVYRAHEEAFSDHFGHVDEEFESGLKRFRHLLVESNEFDKDLWFVAVSGDEVAGYLVGRKKPHEDGHLGWVNILGVRRPWRKHGLGLALLLHSFGEFYRRGWMRAELDVDASSLTGAVRLYERAGMRVVRRHERYELELRPGKELMTTEAQN
ncbi:MAG TPA: GNAT family N-acetyltransferase [Anaerolineales bacterium]|nr:GNAT family N-acetyltransferase [Anaerolineales bacterium]HRQ91840.1 GNAT family N-acetyltransferase [Anaerolineales bacterium]